MSVEIVEAVRVKYPTPLGERHGAFLIELARTLGGGAGLLAKDWGTFVELPDGRKVAQDIICYKVGAGATHFDVLADGEGSADPVWHEVGPIDPARYVDVGASPIPEPPAPIPPVPVPPAPVACKAVETAAEVLDALHEIRIEVSKQNEIVLMALARLENDNRKARTITIKGGWPMGTARGEVSGV